MRPADQTTSAPLLRAVAGPRDEAAWRVFVDRYTPLVHAYCRAAGLQPADAEEVRSRVFARLVTALAGLRYDPARSFRGYLRAVVRTAVADYWQERAAPGATGAGGGLPDAPDEGPADALGEAVEASAAARLAAIARAVERVRALVRDDSWQAYWRTAVEGRPAADVAGELGKSVGAVYMAKHRVAGLLRAEGHALASEGGA